MDRQDRALVPGHLNAQIDAPLHRELVADDALQGVAGNREIGLASPRKLVDPIDDGKAQVVECIGLEPAMDRVEKRFRARRPVGAEVANG